jgi:hypothetical protein
MTPKEQELYQKICHFNLDTPGVIFPFSHKLSWLCRWSEIYTIRVIQEYKKFIFLAMVADHTVSPPAAVDAAWHLHILYTDSYGNELCREILKKELHHTPGQGGIEEEKKYLRFYEFTLETYQKYFGTPPNDIWTKPSLRGQPLSFRWVDARQYLILPNPLYWLQTFWKK